MTGYICQNFLNSTLKMGTFLLHISYASIKLMKKFSVNVLGLYEETLKRGFPSRILMYATLTLGFWHQE